MVMMSEFAAAQTGEIGFRAVGAGAVDAEDLMSVSSLKG
jgi:hypothetical protein